MHAEIDHRPLLNARPRTGRFPRRWLAAWLAPVLLCLIAALHFGSTPASADQATAAAAVAAPDAGSRP